MLGSLRRILSIDMESPASADSDPQQDLELCCQICGVSFNISRIRHANEPFSASWCGKDEGDWIGERFLAPSYILATPASLESCQGCVSVARMRTVDGDAVDDCGSEYVYESDESSEPYENVTPPESLGESSQPEEPGLGQPQERNLTSPELGEADFDRSSTASSDYWHFISSLGSPDDPILEKPNPSLDDLKRSSLNGVEHVAAVGCQSTEGYNGHNISAEEMRACTTAQFLVPKLCLHGAPWNSEPDDADFEGDFFLSGLTEKVPSTESRHSPAVFPARHRVHKVYAQNYVPHWGHVGEASMPFHPYCLEVYKRASLQRRSKVGIESLTGWFRLESNMRDFYSFPRDSAVRRGMRGTWKHNWGDEWLAANPCFVPALTSLLDSVWLPGITTSDPGCLSRRNSLNDVFTCLPTELQLEILRYLEPADIANLAQSSRTFRRLPQSFFREQLIHDMPWLWECWCDLPFSFWATTTEAEQAARAELWNTQCSNLNTWWIPVLNEESENYGGEGLGMAISALRTQLASLQQNEARERQPQPADLLPQTGIDWRRLYILLTRNLASFRGLRNRVRIWEDCQYILDRIDLHQRENRMGDGVTDPVTVARDYVREIYREHPEYIRPIRPH